MKTSMVAVAAFALVATVQSASAVIISGPISGGISLAGTYTTDTGDLNTANAFTSFSGVFITSAAGDYSAGGVTPGTSVTHSAFSFDPFPATGVSPLWAFSSGGNDYAFNLLTIGPIDQPGDNTLELSGSGIVSATGFEDTVATWVFTANQGGGTFSFSSSNASVPDGGTTVALFGLGILGLAATRKMIAKKSA